MQLQDYLSTLRRRWRAVVVAASAFVILGVAIIATSSPTYAASTELFVAPGSTPGSAELVQGSAFYEDRVKTYALIVDSAIVLQPVIDSLGLDMSVRELASKVSATAPVDTVLLRVRVTDSEPERAAQIANAVGQQFVAIAPALESVDLASGDPVVRVTVVEPATEPSAPIAPNKKLILALCLVLGLAIGFAVAILREILDNSVRSEADLRQISDVPVVGKIPQREGDEPLLVDTSGHRAEAYRRLRTNLQFLDHSQHNGTFVLTSALPNDGKSVAATNLALTIAAAGRSVCLIEADLRRPGVSRLLDLESEVGLTSIIVGSATFEQAVQRWGESGLDVIASGPLPPNPSELLNSEAMSTLLTRLRERYEFVIIDTPPLLAVTDAAILARWCGGAIVVVAQRGRNTVRRPQLLEAFTILESAGTKAIGAVLTRVPIKGPDSVALGDYQYAAAAVAPREDPRWEAARRADAAPDEPTRVDPAPAPEPAAGEMIVAEAPTTVTQSDAAPEAITIESPGEPPAPAATPPRPSKAAATSRDRQTKRASGPRPPASRRTGR